MKKTVFYILIIVIIGIFAFLFLKIDFLNPKYSSKGTGLPPTQIPVAAKNPTDPLDMVMLDTPIEGQKITSPLTVSGKARGSWFFEASFPVVLTDWDGKIIAEGTATAKGDWMTAEYVPFTGQLTFTLPEYGDRGSLILRKDNPSGLPQNDAAYEISIVFDR